MDIANFVTALVAALLALWSIRYAATSRTISKDSRDIADASKVVAEKALIEAEQANVIAGRAEAREKERHDVTWDLDTSRAGRYVLTNTGQDVAHSVHATLVLDDRPPVEGQLPRIAPGERIELRIPQAEIEFGREMLERSRAIQQAQSTPFGMATYMGDYTYTTHTFDVRISWLTELGVHRTFENRELDSLGALPH